MTDFSWKITGRTTADRPPEDWRNRLAARLGHRPRRIGMLAELALYGALACLDLAKEDGLPKDALLRLSSSCGPASAILNVLEQIREDLPLPFSFLQSQTSQILPAIAGALNWQGDAAVVMALDPMDSAMLACHQAGTGGMLLGWVEEGEFCRSQWIRLVPCVPPATGFIAASSFEELSSANTHYWRLGRSGMEIARSSGGEKP